MRDCRLVSMISPKSTVKLTSSSSPSRGSRVQKRSSERVDERLLVLCRNNVGHVFGLVVARKLAERRKRIGTRVSDWQRENSPANPRSCTFELRCRRCTKFQAGIRCVRGWSSGPSAFRPTSALRLTGPSEHSSQTPTPTPGEKRQVQKVLLRNGQSIQSPSFASEGARNNVA